MPAKKAAKRGRPKLPKGQALGEPTPIRFQADELVKYERAAAAEGLKLSEWVRKSLNEAVGR